MNPLTPAEAARRAQLYSTVGRAVYTCQMLESQLGIVLALLNDNLALQLDLHSLAAPDDKRTLGQLINALAQFDEAPPETRAILAAALDARNRLIHHFFIRNVDAFTSDRVFEEALSSLKEDDCKLSTCAVLLHGIYERLCLTMRVDSDRIVVRQYRVHDISH